MKNWQQSLIETIANDKTTIWDRGHSETNVMNNDSSESNHHSPGAMESRIEMNEYSSVAIEETAMMSKSGDNMNSPPNDIQMEHFVLEDFYSFESTFSHFDQSALGTFDLSYPHNYVVLLNVSAFIGLWNEDLLRAEHDRQNSVWIADYDYDIVTDYDYKEQVQTNTLDETDGDWFKENAVTLSTSDSAILKIPDYSKYQYQYHKETIETDSIEESCSSTSEVSDSDELEAVKGPLHPYSIFPLFGQAPLSSSYQEIEEIEMEEIGNKLCTNQSCANNCASSDMASESSYGSSLNINETTDFNGTDDMQEEQSSVFTLSEKISKLLPITNEDSFMRNLTMEEISELEDLDRAWKDELDSTEPQSDIEYYCFANDADYCTADFTSDERHAGSTFAGTDSCVSWTADQKAQWYIDPSDLKVSIYPLVCTYSNTLLTIIIQHPSARLSTITSLLSQKRNIQPITVQVIHTLFI